MHVMATKLNFKILTVTSVHTAQVNIQDSKTICHISMQLISKAQFSYEVSVVPADTQQDRPHNDVHGL